MAAIGTYGGKVVVTGSLDEVTAFMKKNNYQYSEKKLCANQTLLPGLIEPHVHIVLSALLKDWIDLTAFTEQTLRPGYSLLWITQIIQSYISENPSESMVLGQGLDPAFMPLVPTESSDTDQQTPGYILNNLQEIDYNTLDGISERVALMMLSASGHTMYLNSLALQMVFEQDDSLKKQYGNDWTKYRDATLGQLQELNGMKPAIDLIFKKKGVSMVGNLIKNLNSYFSEASSRGVTFMYDAAMDSTYEGLLLRFFPSLKKTVRIGAARLCSTPEEVNQLPDYTPVQDYKDVYYGNVKLVSDGSNQGLTGYQSQSYLCAPADNYGIFNFPDPGEDHPTTPTEAYQVLVKTAMADKGWPLMIHANGDLAVKLALDVYKQYITPAKGLRHRIEHCSLLTADDIQAMQDLNISPSFLIGHVGYWGYAFQNAIFGAKSQMLDLCKSAVEKNIRISLHSDHPVSPLGPLRMMEQSVTRIMEADPQLGVLNEGECLTAAQALLAVTYDAAWQCYADRWVGSLGTGYFADFIILDQDPLAMDVTNAYNKMRNIPVLETWKDGRKMWPVS